MADNECINDGDVKRITAAELMPILPSQGGGFRLMFRVEFKDGRTQLRPAADCSCPGAISEYERHYYRAKWAADRDGTPSKTSTSLAPSDSRTKSEASSSFADVDDEATPPKAWQDEGDGSEYADDAHLDHISSDDSLWAGVVDAEGRPGTNPEARAAIRKTWTAGDETFKTPTTEGSGSSNSDEVSERTSKASVKSEALSRDSLVQELKAKALGSPGNGPAPRIRRRGKAARNLAFDKPSHLHTFDEWAFGYNKPDPDVPTGSGLQAEKKRKAEKESIAKVSGTQLRKKIKLEADEESLPATPAFPAGPSEDKEAVEVIDLTLDDDIYTIDSD